MSKMQSEMDFNITTKELIIHEILGKLSTRKKCVIATEYIRKLLTTEQLKREIYNA